MGKRLLPIIVILAMLIPFPGHAVGLGNIIVKSALDQPLEAEIELTSVTSWDLQDLVVQLASAEDFRRVGAERDFFLTQIIFDVVRRSDNSAFVRLTTPSAFNVPFLNIVVEASWPTGRVLREYTALVDPLVLSQQVTIPVQKPAMAAAEPEIAPAAAQSAMSTAARAAPAATATPEQLQTSGLERTNHVIAQHSDDRLTYGPVKRNDTLYVIADKMRPEGITINQMMIALVGENPDAFYNGNINQLKTGQVLRIANPASISAISVADATTEVNRQYAEWKTGKTASQSKIGTGTRTNQQVPAPADAAADEYQVSIIAPAPIEKGSDAEYMERLLEALSYATSELNETRQELDQLKISMAEMREQIESMQSQMLLKDDELVSVQQQLAQASSEASTANRAEPDVSASSLATAVENVPVAEGMATLTTPAPEIARGQKQEDSNRATYAIVALLLIAAAAFIIRRRRIQNRFPESVTIGEGSEDRFLNLEKRA
jgi:pilus assembly protein FimV